MRRVSLTLSVVIILIAWHPFAPVARLQSQARMQSIAPQTLSAIRDWDNTIDSMLRYEGTPGAPAAG